MDETGVLEEGQVFIIMDAKPGMSKVVTGRNLIVTRSPALHPGDVQLVTAVSVPNDSPLMKLSNCICFSQKGERDLPSQLSGGDLDGDLFNVIWDMNARPKRTYDAADYPRQQAIDVGRSVTRDDMTTFFIQFMATDQLGRIATLHKVLADQRPQGTLDIDCLKLANMHSVAVDFSKTGIPVRRQLRAEPSIIDDSIGKSLEHAQI
jgi:RNA dependent RNA polymerase